MGRYFVPQSSIISLGILRFQCDSSELILREVIGGVKIGEILVRRGLISQQQLDRMLQVQRQNAKLLGELLLERYWICQDDLNHALQEQQWREQGLWVIY
jgi:hypothetical protein